MNHAAIMMRSVITDNVHRHQFSSVFYKLFAVHSAVGQFFQCCDGWGASTMNWIDVFYILIRIVCDPKIHNSLTPVYLTVLFYKPSIKIAKRQPLLDYHLFITRLLSIYSGLIFKQTEWNVCEIYFNSVKLQSKLSTWLPLVKSNKHIQNNLKEKFNNRKMKISLKSERWDFG